MTVSVLSDSDLADVLIERLNVLLATREIRTDLSKLANVYVPVCTQTAEHPTLQCTGVGIPALGILGLLNGLVGTITNGDRIGQGFIRAVFDDYGNLFCFERNDVKVASASDKPNV